jgi:hypothetical protein
MFSTQPAHRTELPSYRENYFADMTAVSAKLTAKSAEVLRQLSKIERARADRVEFGVSRWLLQ